MPFVLLTAIFFAALPAFADVDVFLQDVKTANNARICQEAYREFGIGEKKIQMEVIHPNMHRQKFHLPTSVPDYKPAALYIGIGNHPADGFHHWYVDVGKTHASRKGAFGEIIVSNGHIGLNGALFEVQVPPEVAKAIEARALDGKFGGRMSCLHAVCDLLEKEGVILHDRNGQRKVRSRVVLANLLEGKIQILGKDADPDTIRLLTTNENELAHLLGVAPFADKKGKSTILFYVGVGGVAIIGVPSFYAAHEIYRSKQNANEPKYRPLGTNLDD